MPSPTDRVTAVSHNQLLLHLTFYYFHFHRMTPSAILRLPKLTPFVQKHAGCKKVGVNFAFNLIL